MIFMQEISLQRAFTHSLILTTTLYIGLLTLLYWRVNTSLEKLNGLCDYPHSL